MTKKWISLISLALAAVMLLTTPMMAWAEEAQPDPNTNPIRANIDDVSVLDPDSGRYEKNDELTESRELEGDLTIEESKDLTVHSETALTVYDSSFTVSGGVSLDLETKNEESYAMPNGCGVNAQANEGSTKVDVKKDVSVTVVGDGDNWTYSNGYGVRTRTYGDNSVTATIGGDVNVDVTSKDSSEEKNNGVSYAYGIQANAYHGAGTTEITVEGNVSTNANTPDGYAYSEGIVVGNNGAGTTEITVEGNVSTNASTSDGYAYSDGIVVGNQYEYYNENATGSILITVGGDVTATATAGGENGQAEAFGAVVGNGAASTDIVVGGTVSGDTAAVLLSGQRYDKESEKFVPSTIIGDNVTLTVWEIKPNEDGDYAVRRNDEQAPVLLNDEQAPEGEEQKLYKSVEESELKAIQYIIKIQAGQEDIISTEGTSSYTAGERTYDVAHEGDSVTLKLNVPAGYVIDGAYGDEGQSWSLTRDANGNYYLTVPRGGGVMLSVKLSAIVAPAPAPEPERVGGPVWGDVLVTLTDKSGNVTLEFLKDGTFRMTNKNGDYTKGHFWFASKLVSVAETGDEDHASQITLNDASNLFELSLKGSSFELSNNDVKILAANRMQ